MKNINCGYACTEHMNEGSEHILLTYGTTCIGDRECIHNCCCSFYCCSVLFQVFVRHPTLVYGDAA